MKKEKDLKAQELDDDSMSNVSGGRIDLFNKLDWKRVDKDKWRKFLHSGGGGGKINPEDFIK